MNEVSELVKFTDKIKDYIKNNKQQLIKDKSENERRIFEIKLNHNPSLKETVMKKSASTSSYSSLFTDNEDDFNVPDEKDWRKEVEPLKHKVGDFNLNYYLHVLSQEEKKLYDKIIVKIPTINRVYIQQ